MHRGEEPVFRADSQGREPSTMSGLKLIGCARRPKAAAMGQTLRTLPASALQSNRDFAVRLALKVSRDCIVSRWQSDTMDDIGIGAFEGVGLRVPLPFDMLTHFSVSRVVASHDAVATGVPALLAHMQALNLGGCNLSGFVSAKRRERLVRR